MARSDPSILISGGGVAGPATAFWLHRYGFDVTIVERAPSLRTGGQRIELDPVAGEIFRRMGLREQFDAVGGRPPVGTVYIGRRNRPVPMPDWGTGGLSIQRGPLGELLYNHVRNDVPIIFDDSITRIDQTDDGVDVIFERTPTRRFDLVIGADGLHSNTRSLVFGDRDRFIHYLGTNLIICTVPNYLHFRRRMTMHLWPHRGASITTFPDDTMLEGAFLFRTPEPLDTRGMTRADAYELAHRTFGRDGWLVPGLLRQLRESHDVHVAPSMQVRMDRWVSGRVALIGDAGYCPDPMSGQGATLALVGAYILAGELHAAGGDHRAAFAAYEVAMGDFVKANQGIATFGTEALAPSSGRFGVWLREQSMRVMFPLLRLGHRLGVGRQLFDMSDRIRLTDYATSVVAR